MELQLSTDITQKRMFYFNYGMLVKLGFKSQSLKFCLVKCWFRFFLSVGSQDVIREKLKIIASVSWEREAGPNKFPDLF